MDFDTFSIQEFLGVIFITPIFSFLSFVLLKFVLDIRESFAIRKKL